MFKIGFKSLSYSCLGLWIQHFEPQIDQPESACILPLDLPRLVQSYFFKMNKRGPNLPKS